MLAPQKICLKNQPACFDEKQDPTTSVQMKLEFRKMGKANLWVVMVGMIMPLDGHGGDHHDWKKR